MEDWIIVKRKAVRGMKDVETPLLKLNPLKCRFSLNNALCKTLEVKAGDGVMFQFNKSAKRMSVRKESDLDPDSFILCNNNQSGLRFSSVDLFDIMEEVYGLSVMEQSTVKFKVKANDVYLWQEITLIN